MKMLDTVHREQAGKKFEPINNPVRPQQAAFLIVESGDLDMLMG
jgi:hypothetical protein